MELLIFPHRSEAKLFFESFSWKKENIFEGQLFSSDDKVLLISGENPLQVSIRVASTLAFLGEKIEKVFHGGVALCIYSQDCALEKVYPIRTVYGSSDLSFWQKSFKLNEEGLDIISTSKRIQDKEEQKHFSHFASLLDREAYAVAYACSEFKKPLTIRKYAFLEKDNFESCRDIPKLSEEISFLLLKEWQKTREVEEKRKPNLIFPENLYFTEAMKKKYVDYITQIQTQEKISIEEIWEKAKLFEINQEKTSPKEKAKKFLENLFSYAYPQIYELQKMQEKKLKILKEAGWQIDLQRALENGEISINAKIKDLEQKNRLAKALLELHEI